MTFHHFPFFELLQKDMDLKYIILQQREKKPRKPPSRFFHLKHGTQFSCSIDLNVKIPGDK